MPRSTNVQGRHRSYSGEELAAMIGMNGGPTAVAGAIRNFRIRVKRTLLVQANVAIDPSVDLIVNDRQHGYRFSDKITVTERPSLTAGSQAESCSVDPVTDVPSSNDTDDVRARWILAELKKAGQIRKQQIIQRTGWSDSTVRRALTKLRDDGKIVFEGSARNGYWRLV